MKGPGSFRALNFGGGGTHSELLTQIYCFFSDISQYSYRLRTHLKVMDQDEKKYRNNEMKNIFLILLANLMLTTALVAQERVLVAGSFIQDLAFHVDRLPLPGETKIGTFVTGPGGKGSNQAVACARQGIETCFVGTVGQDTFGTDAIKFLQNEGIHTHVTTTHEEGTGTAAIMVDQSGQNSIIVFLGANEYTSSLSIQQAHEAFNPDVVLLQFEINMDAISQYLALLPTDCKPLIVLNPAPIPQELDLKVLEKVDILTPNETEFWSLIQRKSAHTQIQFEEISSTDPKILHAACRSLQVPIVIVTMGEHGCFVSTDKNYYWVKAPKVEVVSTAGAGDCFSGVLASQLAIIKSRNLCLEEHLKTCIEYAVIAASLSVTKDGTAPSMPTYQITMSAIEALK